MDLLSPRSEQSNRTDYSAAPTDHTISLLALHARRGTNHYSYSNNNTTSHNNNNNTSAYGGLHPTGPNGRSLSEASIITGGGRGHRDGAAAAGGRTSPSSGWAAQALGWLQPWRTPEDCRAGGLALADSLAPLLAEEDLARHSRMQTLYGDSIARQRSYSRASFGDYGSAGGPTVGSVTGGAAGVGTPVIAAAAAPGPGGINSPPTQFLISASVGSVSAGSVGAGGAGGVGGGGGRGGGGSVLSPLRAISDSPQSAKQSRIAEYIDGTKAAAAEAEEGLGASLNQARGSGSTPRGSLSVDRNENGEDAGDEAEGPAPPCATTATPRRRSAAPLSHAAAASSPPPPPTAAAAAVSPATPHREAQQAERDNGRIGPRSATCSPLRTNAAGGGGGDDEDDVTATAAVPTISRFQQLMEEKERLLGQIEAEGRRHPRARGNSTASYGGGGGAGGDNVDTARDGAEWSAAGDSANCSTLKHTARPGYNNHYNSSSTTATSTHNNNNHNHSNNNSYNRHNGDDSINCFDRRDSLGGVAATPPFRHSLEGPDGDSPFSATGPSHNDSLALDNGGRRGSSGNYHHSRHSYNAEDDHEFEEEPFSVHDDDDDENTPRPQEEEEEYKSENNFGEGGHYACVPGTTLHQRYLLMRRLGTGRSSTVWLAADREQVTISRRHLIRQLGEEHVRRLFKPEDNPVFVAIKVFRCGDMYAECGEYERAVLRYLSERRADAPWFARLTIMRAHFTVTGDYGLHHCLVMDVVGSGVDAAINETELEGLPLEVSQTILITALQGLATLAALNIVHSDVKPENLLFVDLDPSVAAEMAEYQATHLRTGATAPLWSASQHRRMSVADYARRQSTAQQQQQQTRVQQQPSSASLHAAASSVGADEEESREHFPDEALVGSGGGTQSHRSNSKNNNNNMNDSEAASANTSARYNNTSSYSNADFNDSTVAASAGPNNSDSNNNNNSSDQRAFFDVQVSDLGLSFVVPLPLRDGPAALAELGGDDLLDLTPGAQLEEIAHFLTGADAPSFVHRADASGTGNEHTNSHVGLVSVKAAAAAGGTRPFVPRDGDDDDAPSTQLNNINNKSSTDAHDTGGGPGPAEYPNLRQLVAHPPSAQEMVVLAMQNYTRGALVQSREYRSPEVVLGNYVLPPCDVWSMGCIAYELVTGTFLFDSMTAREEAFRERRRQQRRRQRQAERAARRNNGAGNNNGGGGGGGLTGALRRLGQRLQGGATPTSTTGNGKNDSARRTSVVGSAEGTPVRDGGGGAPGSLDGGDRWREEGEEEYAEEEDEEEDAAEEDEEGEVEEDDVLSATVEPIYFEDVEKDTDVFHLRLMMRLLGPPPLAYLDRDPAGLYVDDFYDEEGNFLFLSDSDSDDGDGNDERDGDGDGAHGKEAARAARAAEYGYDLIAPYRNAELERARNSSASGSPTGGDDSNDPLPLRDPSDTSNYSVCAPGWAELRRRVRSKLPSRENADLFEAFLWRCLQWDPERRGTAAELLEDPWLRSRAPLAS